MDSQPKRRWFSFSLRTMFVATTLVACWLGWQVKIVRDRKEMRQWIVANSGTTHHEDEPFLGVRFDTIETLRPISRIRQLLGDEEVTCIALPPTSTRSEQEQIRKLFPESKIYFQ